MVGLGEKVDLLLPSQDTPHTFVSLLNTHSFLGLAYARGKMETWRRYYNEDWPYGAIGNVPPVALMKVGGITSPAPTPGTLRLTGYKFGSTSSLLKLILYANLMTTKAICHRPDLPKSPVLQK